MENHVRLADFSNVAVTSEYRSVIGGIARYRTIFSEIDIMTVSFQAEYSHATKDVSAISRG